MAKIWGLHKNNKNMTYEKLSRALRWVFVEFCKNIVKVSRVKYHIFLQKIEYLVDFKLVSKNILRRNV